MIPPGFHFIYYSAVSKEGQTAPRTGFFHFFHSKEVVVKKWNPEFEVLTENSVDGVLIERIKCNLMDLDSSLGPYPFDSFKKWTTLTNHIHQPILEKIQPISGEISSVTQISTQNKQDVAVDGVKDSSSTYNKDNDQATMPSQAQKKRDLFFAGVGSFPLEISHEAKATPTSHRLTMTVNPQTALRFSRIPQQKHPVGSTPTEITLHNLDLSYTLETFIKDNYEDDVKGVLGELQLAFVCFIVGQVYEAFEQWKRLVHILCCSEKSLQNHVDLFQDFVSMMHFQLREIPDDFFVDIVSRDNFLTKTLQIFFSNVSQCEGLDVSLAKKALQFRDNLTKRYNWDFTSEPDEDAPVIVDLNDSND